MQLESIYNHLHTWFREYTGKFLETDTEIRHVHQLKIDHTERVVSEIAAIVKSESFDDRTCTLARIEGLLHDIGRYEQYRDYGTFLDVKSVNHAQLGLQILDRENVLSCLENIDSTLVKRAIELHNKASLPDDEPQESLLHARMLRDADKIDILNIVTSYFLDPRKEKNSAIELELDDDQSISPETLELVLAGKGTQVKKLKTVNDMKVLQMSWVFDLNFPYSFHTVRERRYLEKLFETMHEVAGASDVYTLTSSHLAGKTG